MCGREKNGHLKREKMRRVVWLIFQFNIYKGSLVISLYLKNFVN